MFHYLGRPANRPDGTHDIQSSRLTLLMYQTIVFLVVVVMVRYHFIDDSPSKKKVCRVACRGRIFRVVYLNMIEYDLCTCCDLVSPGNA